MGIFALFLIFTRRAGKLLVCARCLAGPVFKESERARAHMASYGGWIGVDLDGTLARSMGGDGSGRGGPIGEPVPAMLGRVWTWLADGQTVKIVTARVAYDPDGSARRLVEDWCERYVGMRLEVTCSKDFGMIELWDDRCIQVVPDTGQPIGVTGAFRWLFYFHAAVFVAGAWLRQAVVYGARATAWLQQKTRHRLARLRRRPRS